MILYDDDDDDDNDDEDGCFRAFPVHNIRRNMPVKQPGFDLGIFVINKRNVENKNKKEKGLKKKRKRIEENEESKCASESVFICVGF